MPTKILSGGSLLIDDGIRRKAEAFVDEAADRKSAHLEVVLDDGERITLPSDLARLFAEILQGVANGPVSIQTTPDVLTTTVAAEMLSVSRPTLMKWINSGELSSHKVGSHTRVNTTDVLEFRKKLGQKRRDAFAALRRWDEEFGED